MGNSDHSVIKFEINFSPKFNSTKELIRDWRKGDEQGLIEHMNNIDFASLLQSQDANTAWVTLKDTISDAMDRYIPLTHRRKPGQPLWMNKNVKNLTNLKRRHWKRFKKNRTEANFDQFKLSEKKCKKAVQSAKRTFERNIAKSGNKRPFNAYVKAKSKSRVNVGPLKVNNTLVSDNKGMAEVLNNYFTSVFSKEDPNNVPTPDRLPSASVLSDMNFSIAQVKNKLDKLKHNSAPGPDNITARFLRINSESVAPALAIIFNKSLESGIVPDDWKTANVTPIFKKGGRGNPGNYRPVSLTSICCKVHESCMKDTIVDHLVTNALIKDSQHGFMKNKSCTTNLLEFLEKVTSEHEAGNPMDIIYLDFSKAFDKVPHLRLIEKFKAHSIEGNILRWIKNWLSGRKQRTVLNGETSDWEDVTSGVPQGSVLGPLAFVIFINDVDVLALLIAILNKFADDTKLGNKACNQQDIDALQKCLNDLVEWSELWGMQFNVSKCKVMHVGKHNPKAIYTMNGVPLTETTAERDIGVKVHSSLRPSVQCKEAGQRANAVLGQVTRSFHYRDKKTFVQLYMRYVRPHLEFATPAWSPWTATDKEVLERVQRRAIKMVSGLAASTYEDRLRELGLLSLEDRRIQLDLVQTFKILRGFDDVKCSTWFELVGDTPHRVTRHTSDPLNIVRKNPRTDIRRHFFSNRVIEYWNLIPSDTKNVRTVSAFKAKVSDMLLNKHFDARPQ